MSSICLKCRENTESRNEKSVKTKNERITLFSNYTASTIIKEQEARKIIGSTA